MSRTLDLELRRVGAQGSDMNKLPVFSTLGNAVSFPFREISAVVRLSWLPMLILTAAYVYFMKEYLAIAPTLMQGLGTGADPQIPLNFLALEFGFLAIYLVVNAVVSVALYRLIFTGDRRPGTFVYFGFGKAELLLIVQPIVLGLIVMVYALVFGLGMGLLAAVGASALPPDLVPIVLGVVPLIFVLFIIWFVIRMVLWAPNIVAENRFSILGAAKVTKGNFWRLLGLFVLYAIVLIIIQVIIFAILGALFGSAMPAFPMIEPGASPEQLQQQMGEMMRALAEFIEKNIVVVGAVAYVLFLIVNAMTVGLLGYAYKGIKGSAGPSAAAEF